MTVHPIDSSLTVVVPTHNRAHFLARLLRYAEECEFPFPLRIIDSSNELHRSRNRELATGSRLAPAYEHCDLPIIEKMLHAMQQVTTPFSCFWADDDFQLPHALRSGARFLAEHADFTCAMGQSLSVMQRRNSEIRARDSRSLDFDSPAARIETWSRRFFSTFYGVYRSEHFRYCLERTSQIADYARSRIIPEILMGELGLLLGKFQRLDAPSLIYMTHAGNESHLVPCVRDEAGFDEHYHRYLEGFADDLCRLGGMHRDDALRLARRAFRNVYQWNGGRWKWIRKSLRELRRVAGTLGSAAATLAGVRRSPMCERLPADDPRLADPDVTRALRFVREFPEGILQRDLMSRPRGAA